MCAVVRPTYQGSTLSAGNRFYFGWVIAILSLVIMCVTNGSVLAGLTVYDEYLLEMLAARSGEPGLVGELKLRDLITLGVSGLLAPFVGALADRVGVRPVMLVGLVLLAAGNFLYASVGSLPGIYGIHLMLAGVLAGSGLLVNVMLVSKWFVKNRGLAVGLTVAGTSVGNAAMPQVNVLLIESFGWRDAFLYSTALPLVLLPLVWLVVRERPEDMGLTAPGAETGAGSQPLSLTGMRYRDALRTANFWLLAGIAMMTFYSVLGLLQHIYLYLLGRDFTPQAAASGLSTFAILGLVGKLIAGVLAERLGRKRVFLTTLGVMCAGTWLILNVELAGIWLPLVLVGAGWGGLYTLLQLLAADIFGVRELGKILGTITVLDAIGGGLGPAVTGFLYDRSGSYALPFTVIAVLVTLALAAATQVRIPERQA